MAWNQKNPDPDLDLSARLCILEAGLRLAQERSDEKLIAWVEERIAFTKENWK